MLHWEWLKILLLASICGLGLILIRFLFPKWKNQKVTVLGEGQGRVGSLAIIISTGTLAVSSGATQDSYLFFSFLPLFLTQWIREHRGEFSGQNIFIFLSWVLAGLGLYGESTFISEMGLSDVPTILLTGGLVALVTIGYSRFLFFSGLSTGWAFFVMGNIALLTESLHLQRSMAGFSIVLLINGLWSLARKNRDVDSFGGMWIGFWLVNQSLSLEATGFVGRDGLIWGLLLALPLFEGVSFFFFNNAKLKGLVRATFVIHLKNLSLRPHQIVLYLCGLGAYSTIAVRVLTQVRDETAWFQVAIMGVAGVAMFFGFSYLVHHQRKNHVHNVSQTLLQRYLRLQKELSLNVDEFQSIVYDLLPYYRQLEQRGISDIQEFLHDFGVFLQKLHTNQPALLVGSYTVLVVEPKLDPAGPYLTGVTREYFAFLESKGLNPVISPGYFSSHSKANQFLQRFGHLITHHTESPNNPADAA